MDTPTVNSAVASSGRPVLAPHVRLRVDPTRNHHVLLSPENQTLQPGLAVLQGAYSTHYAIVMAGAVIASVPVLILFTLAQRQIVESVAASGLKG